MFPEIACLRRGIVTLVAFVWFFSTVRPQMCFQMACMKVMKVWSFAIPPTVSGKFLLFLTLMVGLPQEAW